MAKIYIAKNGRKYIKTRSGRAKFISSSTRVKKVVRSRTMARRKKKSYRSKRSSMFGKLNQPITGALGVVAYESFISPMLPVQGVTKDLLELSAGYFLSKKKGIIGATGKSLLVINSYQILSGMIGSKLTGMFNGTNTTTSNSGSW
jgi:hypothetical protein